MGPMNEIAILSPHFDDGVLSCGGRIWSLRQQGYPVQVITLFAGGPPIPLPPFAAYQHRKWGDVPDITRLRQAEDRAAYMRLGCEALHYLAAPDAIYRLDERGAGRYASNQALFGPLHPEEAAYAAELATQVAPLLAAGTTLLAPLAVGQHVDHQLAYRVGWTLREMGWRVRFYEELPYVEWEGARASALRDKVGWQAEHFPLSEEAMASKVAAMAYYRSQIPVLYGDDLSMSRRIRAVGSEVTSGVGYAERLWLPPEDAEGSQS